MLVPEMEHLEVYEIMTIFDAADEVSAQLQAQEYYHLDMPESLVRLIQMDFNKSFQKVFTSALPVRCPLLANLT